MHTLAATTERPHLACVCPASAAHSAWDIAPCAVGPHDLACPLGDTRVPADDRGHDAAGTPPDLWLG